MEKIIQNLPWEKWVIDDLLGRGAFGEVYKVKKHSEYSQTYSAVKIIKIPADEGEVREMESDGRNPDSIRRYYQPLLQELVNEITMMESLKGSAHIVSIEDSEIVERADGIGWTLFIRMELLKNLNTYRKEHPMDVKQVIKLGADICDALTDCQKKRVVHRDIKPSNIFISEFGEFKLGDFGISRHLERTSSMLSQKGTGMYMAPEVYYGQKYNASVDIYSLGLVLYRLLNHGRMPFMPEDALATDHQNALQRRLSGEVFPDPESGGKWLGDVLRKACHTDPAERFATPQEFKEALLSFEDMQEEQRDEEGSGEGQLYDWQESERGFETDSTPKISGEEGEEKAESVMTEDLTFRMFAAQTKETGVDKGVGQENSEISKGERTEPEQEPEPEKEAPEGRISFGRMNKIAVLVSVSWLLSIMAWTLLALADSGNQFVAYPERWNRYLGAILVVLFIQVICGIAVISMTGRNWAALVLIQTAACAVNLYLIYLLIQIQSDFPYLYEYKMRIYHLLVFSYVLLSVILMMYYGIKGTYVSMSRSSRQAEDKMRRRLIFFVNLSVLIWLSLYLYQFLLGGMFCVSLGYIPTGEVALIFICCVGIGICCILAAFYSRWKTGDWRTQRRTAVFSLFSVISRCLGIMVQGITLMSGILQVTGFVLLVMAWMSAAVNSKTEKTDRSIKIMTSLFAGLCIIGQFIAITAGVSGYTSLTGDWLELSGILFLPGLAGYAVLWLIVAVRNRRKGSLHHA